MSWPIRFPRALQLLTVHRRVGASLGQEIQEDEDSATEITAAESLRSSASARDILEVRVSVSSTVCDAVTTFSNLDTTVNESIEVVES
jgi:hypothetical protein